jgi:hypothetical protein
VKNGGADVVSFLFGVYDLCTHEEATVTSLMLFVRKELASYLRRGSSFLSFSFIYIYIYIYIFKKIKLYISHLFKTD